MKEDPTASAVNEKVPAYEKDPRFLELIQKRLEHSKDRNNLIPAEVVLANIRKKYGLK